MRLTSFLLLATLLQASARGVSQTVTYSAKKVKLEKLFTIITRQTGYVFFYHSQDIEAAAPVSVQWKDAPLKTALEESLKDQP
ncbi:MAG TPA: hypothetical protein VG605_08555, partial [Puia sp.]|nr:hypothetical protein [Puia sp.]